MKLYKFFMLLGVVALMASCNKDPEYYELPDQPDEMHVKLTFGNGGDAEKNLIHLSGTYLNEEAVKLTWDAIPSEYPVTYLVRFFATENKNESTTDYYEVGSNTEFSITHNDLNSIVARWAIPGDEVPISAEIVGTVNNDKHYIKPEVSVYEFNAIGWEKYPTSLHIHMTDLNGRASMVELTQPQLGTGVYSAQINVNPCTFYFTKTSYAPFPAYYNDGEGKLLYVEDEGEYETFSTTETGLRTIMVDVNDEYLDVRVLNIQMPAGANPYMVGDGTDIGWTTKSAAGYMVQATDPRTPYVYSYTGQFYAQNEFPGSETSEGTFKILVDDSFSSNGFFAPEFNCNPLTNHVLPKAGDNAGSDFKWLVPATGKYTFTIDALNMTTSFVPAE